MRCVGNEKKKQMFEWAASIRYDDVVETRRLLSYADRHDTSNAQAETPVMFAAHFNAKACLHWLLESGFDVHSRDVNGKTALHHGAQQNHKEVCQTLLSHGANVNAVDLNGRTALDTILHFSVNFDGAKTFEPLIDAGASYSKHCSDFPPFQRRRAWNRRAIALRNALYAARRRFPRDLRTTLMRAFYALRWQ